MLKFHGTMIDVEGQETYSAEIAEYVCRVMAPLMAKNHEIRNAVANAFAVEGEPDAGNFWGMCNPDTLEAEGAMREQLEAEAAAQGYRQGKHGDSYAYESPAGRVVIYPATAKRMDFIAHDGASISSHPVEVTLF